MDHGTGDAGGRRLGPGDVDALALGAGVLGTGGGGDPRLGRLRLRALLDDDNHPDSVDLLDPADLPEDASVVGVGGIGAPTVTVEKPYRGDEELRSLRLVEDAAGVEIDAVMGFEIGGKNGLTALSVGALAGLPVLDADGMGRAFPELQMTTFYIYGVEPSHAAITDERGIQVLYRNADSPGRLERLARANTVELGGRAGIAFPLLTGSEAVDTAIHGTVTRALRIGRAVLDARSRGADPVDALCERTGGRPLFSGKVVDVHRRTTAGFARGHVDLDALVGDGTLVVEFQNEFLVARDGNGSVLASVPDLLVVVDIETAEPVPTSDLRYGQRVVVVGIPAPAKLRTDRALAVVGPEAMGYEEAYDPLD